MPAFYTGIWGDDTPTVLGDEDSCNAMLRNSGQMIHFRHHDITVFTEGADPADNCVQTVIIYEVLAGRTQSEARHLINLSKQMDKFRRKYQGKRYIIYLSDKKGKPLRRYLYSNLELSNIVNVTIGYCKDTNIIKRVGFTSEMITTSQADLYNARIKILMIVTGTCRTYIIVQQDEVFKRRREIIHVSRNPKKWADIQKRLADLAVAENNNTMYIYSTNRGLLPHVHQHHLELMRDYIINSQQVDIFLASQYQPASEDQIRYGDDDEIPVETGSPQVQIPTAAARAAAFNAEAFIRYDDAYEDD
jgi:hypothetical protein